MLEDVTAQEILVTERPHAAYPHPLDSLPRASFISQLIAERYHLAPQRMRHRTSLDVALDCYDATDQQTPRRMPPGYRTSFSA
jgi:hypothetical protein